MEVMVLACEARIGGQHLKLAIYANDPGLVRFRLYRTDAPEPSAVDLLAAIDRGESYEVAAHWRRCTLRYALHGTLDPSFVELTLQVYPGETRFEVTWDTTADDVPIGSPVNLTPWVGFA